MTGRLSRSPAFAALDAAAAERILILDGAMGTQIQQLRLAEDDYTGHGSGHACRHHSDHPQQGNNDLLILTQPQAVEEIHYRYAMAGADIVETNTFSATTIAQADYGMQEAVHDLNVEGARIVRRALDRATAQDGRPRFVAGAIGPTNRTASISPDVNDPGYRAVTFDDLRAAYLQQARGLIEGGADILLIETIFDTLNAKAAIFACEERFAEKGIRLPVMISFNDDPEVAQFDGPDGDVPLAHGQLVPVEFAQQRKQFGRFHELCFSLHVMQTRVQGMAFSRGPAISSPQSRQMP